MRLFLALLFLAFGASVALAAQDAWLAGSYVAYTSGEPGLNNGTTTTAKQAEESKEQQLKDTTKAKEQPPIPMWERMRSNFEIDAFFKWLDSVKGLLEEGSRALSWLNEGKRANLLGATRKLLPNYGDY